MKKSNKIMLFIVIFLVIIIVIFGFLNKENTRKNSELNEKGIVLILENGNEIGSYELSEIIKLGESTFNANLKTNGKKAEGHEYTGVLLKKILSNSKIELKSIKAINVIAADGYVVSISREKVKEEDNVYLVYKKDGNYIGAKKDGGDGPYQIIIRKDQFSQFWCKYVVSIEVK